VTLYRPRLQRRLMLVLGGYAVLVGALFGGLAMAFVYAVEDQFFVTTLRAEADRQRQHHGTHGAWTTPALPFIHLYAQGQGLPADLARLRAAQPQAGELDGDDGRHFHLLRLHPDGSLLVAEVSQQLVVRPLRQTLLAWLLACGGAAVALALLLAALLARRTSAPLARLAQAVASSQPDALPGNLASLEPGPVHDEVGELARHLDVLHQRTRDFIAREQAFTGDASHELRTPLAVLGVAVERLRQQAPPTQQTVLASMQAALWQLQQTVEMLLALAREAPAEAPAQERLLLPVLEQTLLAHAPLLEQQGVQIELHVPPRTTRRWPPALTQLLVSNLLANALAHTRAPLIRIEADAHRLSLCNASDAPPAALLAEGAAGRQPGLKGPASSGQGLGLSIVRRLAERHGLSLTLTHEQGRTCATLSATPREPLGEPGGFTSGSRTAA
jgi:signal transduction histidine kinase